MVDELLREREESAPRKEIINYRRLWKSLILDNGNLKIYIYIFSQGSCLLETGGGTCGEGGTD